MKSKITKKNISSNSNSKSFFDTKRSFFSSESNSRENFFNPSKPIIQRKEKQTNKTENEIKEDETRYYYDKEGTLLGIVGDEGSDNMIRVVGDWIRDATASEIININSGTRTEYFIYHNSEKLFETKWTTQAKIIESIFESEIREKNPKLKNTEVKFVLEDNDVIGFCRNCKGDGTGGAIGINPNKSFLNNRNNLIAILKKESIHLLDKDKQENYGTVGRDLLGHEAILNTAEFKKSTKDFKRDFLQSAGDFIWQYKQAMLNTKDLSAKASYQTFIDNRIKVYKAHGIEFDFSKLIEAYNFMGGANANSGRGVDVEHSTHDIGIILNGETL